MNIVSRKWIVLLDYDGTLTPIHARPQEAKIDKNRKRFLEDLSRKHKLAIITGRDLNSFIAVFGSVPKTIYLITSHGAKIYKGESLIADFSGSKVPDLHELREKVKGMEGVFVEEKDGCFAIHFREYRGDENRVKEAFYEFVEKNPPSRTIEGKKILEALYGDFDKGRGVERFLGVVGWKGGEKLLYVGDDTTDLFALRRVRELGGRAVFVGEKKPPEANELVRSVEDVYNLLRALG